jgi:hypothetical protein
MGISVCVMRLQVETELLHVSNSLELLYYTPKKKKAYQDFKLHRQFSKISSAEYLEKYNSQKVFQRKK